MILISKLIAVLTFVLFPQQEPVGESWGTAEEASKYYSLDEKLLPASAYYTLNEIPQQVIEPSAGTTRGVIDFQRPDDAVQLVGDDGSKFVPESGKRTSLWVFENGVLTASPKWDHVVTPAAYQDFRMHVEFNVNDAGHDNRESNGNSGVYLQERYELQIANSYGIPESEYKASYCGSVYRIKKPDALVCKPAGQWQDFDIAFRAARFVNGKKTENARITVYQNGKLIHDDFSIPRKTGVGRAEEPSARPIKLQGHHNAVRFRNLWIQPLSLGDSSAPVPDITASQKSLPVAGESFKFNGHDAFVISPKKHRGQKDSDPTPWVWYAPTLPKTPGPEESWMFERFLKSGVSIVGIDVGESYGSPTGRKIYDEFYEYLTHVRQLNKKPVLLARSRGGLMLYSWAIKNPQSVGGIAGIYPVCDIASYPGINRACGAYQLSAEQLQKNLSTYNPVDRLGPLAAADVPIFHIHGDQDDVVPLDANSALMAARYKELGGNMELEIVQGQGHNMWKGWFQSQKLVNFAIEQAGGEVHPHPIPESDLWLTYRGNTEPEKNGADKPGAGKHVVLIAAEQEYRSEQAMPMLAKVLATHHGFDCTVLFSVNEKGEVDPTLPAPFKDKTKRHNIPGLEYLADADCVILLSRLMQLPDDQMKHFHDYFDSGKPLIALRTANHGFRGGKPYEKGGQPVSLRNLLGGAFIAHHGGWHRESTTGMIVPENKTHPILTGVNNIWGTSDVYRCHDEKNPFPDDCLALVMGQPMKDLTQGSPPNPAKQPLPVAWTKTWIGNRELPSKIFHFTMGSAEDFENEGVRKLTVNAVYWGLGMNDEIEADRCVDIVGEYQPLKPGFNYDVLGVQPHQASFYK